MKDCILLDPLVTFSDAFGTPEEFGVLLDRLIFSEDAAGHQHKGPGTGGGDVVENARLFHKIVSR